MCFVFVCLFVFWPCCVFSFFAFDYEFLYLSPAKYVNSLFGYLRLVCAYNCYDSDSSSFFYDHTFTNYNLFYLTFFLLYFWYIHDRRDDMAAPGTSFFFAVFLVYTQHEDGCW